MVKVGTHLNFSREMQREKYVMLHGQPLWFRMIKYPVFLLIGYLIYSRSGWFAVVQIFLFLAVLGIGLHFFLRWKTHGWRKKWGPVKRIKTPFDAPGR
jgi:hypothetical protein